MKKIFITFAIIIASLSGFSQSFSVDNKSLSVPRYANQAAITAAITAPIEGMLVFNNALDVFVYWNGTAWTNFPAASGTPTWTLSGSTLVAATAATSGIQTSFITATGVSSLANPLINSTGTNSAFFRYGTSGAFGNQAMTQESTTGTTPSTSSMEWKYYSSPSVAAIPMFGYASSAFNVSGGLNVSGITTLSSNATIMGTGATRGKFLIGTATTQSANTGLEILATNATLANPNIYIKSPSTGMIRFGGASGEEGVYNIVDPSGTPSSASVRWIHIGSTTGNPPTNPQTVMLELRGNGNMIARGFTKLGGAGSDVPSIKTKLLTGITNSGTGAGLQTMVAHGLDASKIISVTFVIEAGIFGYVSGTENRNPSTTFTSSFGGTNVVLTRLEDDATSNLESRNFKVYVTYTE